MKQEALYAARTVSPKVPLDVARAVPFIQNAIVMPELTLLTFGEWEAVLDVPAPDASLELATVMHRYGAARWRRSGDSTMHGPCWASFARSRATRRATPAATRRQIRCCRSRRTPWRAKSRCGPASRARRSSGFAG